MTLLLVVTVLAFMGTVCLSLLGLVVYGIRSEQRQVPRVATVRRGRAAGRSDGRTNG